MNGKKCERSRKNGWRGNMIVDGKVVASYEGLNHPQKNKLPKSQFPTLGEFFVIALNFTKLEHLLDFHFGF